MTEAEDSYGAVISADLREREWDKHGAMCASGFWLLAAILRVERRDLDGSYSM